MVDDSKKEYRKAYHLWTGHLQALHSVLLDGERLDPVKLKAILNREARSKERYDEARKKLLGLSG